MHCVYVQRGAYPPVTSARLFLQGSAKFLFNASALLWLWLFLQIIGANVVAGWVCGCYRMVLSVFLQSGTIVVARWVVVVMGGFFICVFQSIGAIVVAGWVVVVVGWFFLYFLVWTITIIVIIAPTTRSK